MTDTYEDEVKEFKLNAMKTANMLFQAAIAFAVTAGTTYFTGSVTGKAALFAGGLTACGYVAGNLQNTGGYKVSLKGLKDTEPK